jgi:hypothetical protein
MHELAIEIMRDAKMMYVLQADELQGVGKTDAEREDAKVRILACLSKGEQLDASIAALQEAS